ncbi:beta-ketoacyl-[acyl-carrier-protein] synthase family protein [Streptomyces triticirhizae]|uniref:3-oxoacyl-[acyl-carrier-protein] synthase 1 n=1 Tax=Streptomyces triticirhizae TaxID=2483353 RepID=A0A3M2M6N9_9ACTN|nr:beta-ketoacyl-[acyl-carrier-protein] synthase family protein [Streptomyces triticirhizae]RMI45182.1 beta-ketoacyl-[acyl-carrier-protein] synthase family protein [Streptomyces triticirhizae]
MPPETRARAEGRRVVVTGIGVVSSVGIGVAAFTEAIRAGRTGTFPITSFPTEGFPVTMAGEVSDFDAADWLERLTAEEWGRSAQFAAVAARLAVRDAGIDPETLGTVAAGSVMGTTGGESTVLQELAEAAHAGGLKSLAPEVVWRLPASRIANAVNSELGLTGEAQTVPTACSASNFALGYAYDLVSGGEADLMLAGGADAVNRATHAGFFQLGALSPDVCRPFDAERAGILTAEGGVVLLLEPLTAALARGARIYAELLGYGANCDARHMVNPDAGSIAECIRLAQADAGVGPEEIDYICAHGTGTPTNDATEIAAARMVFGDRLPPISSIKSAIGHTMGAASGLGAVICCMALRDGFLPPTAHLRAVDPKLGPGVDPVPGTARPARPRVAQNHGFAFGGNNAITLFGRYEADRSSKVNEASEASEANRANGAHGRVAAGAASGGEGT